MGCLGIVGSYEGLLNRALPGRLAAGGNCAGWSRSESGGSEEIQKRHDRLTLDSADSEVIQFYSDEL